MQVVQLVTGCVDTQARLFIHAYSVAICLASVNSCVNPVIYAILSKSFRDNFGRLLCCGPCQPATQPGGDGGDDMVMVSAAVESSVK